MDEDVDVIKELEGIIHAMTSCEQLGYLMLNREGQRTMIKMLSAVRSEFAILDKRHNQEMQVIRDNAASVEANLKEELDIAYDAWLKRNKDYNELYRRYLELRRGNVGND